MWQLHEHVHYCSYCERQREGKNRSLLDEEGRLHLSVGIRTKIIDCCYEVCCFDKLDVDSHTIMILHNYGIYIYIYSQKIALLNMIRKKMFSHYCDML